MQKENDKNVLVETDGMHCFFSRQGKKIKFNIKSCSLNFTVIRSSIQPDTLAKLCCGLNHFLAYYYATDREEYEKISVWIFGTFCNICNEIKRNVDRSNYLEVKMNMIVKYCQLDPYIIDKICRYVYDNSVDNINDDDATTDITLTNEHTKILACVATAIKFSYLFASLLRDSMKFEQTMLEFIDHLLTNIISVDRNYYAVETDDGLTMDEDCDEIHSYLDNFIAQLVTKIWNSVADPSFKRKFEETGQDTFYYARKHKISIITAFKKYVPPVVDLDTGKEYAADDQNPKMVYYTVGKDYRDFKFVAKNLAAYIQRTITNIITRQDTKVTLLDVNIPDFIIDGSDEKSIRKEAAFYEDRDKHLFELRKKTAVDLFQKIIDELMKYDLDMTFIKKFKVGKNHVFNQFIIHKCLLSLTGESRVYSETFGVYNKFILLLFYLGIKHRKDLSFFHNTVEIMKMDPTPMPTQTDEQIAEYLEEHNIKDISGKAFNAPLKLYASDNNQMVLSKDDFLDMFVFMSSPARVRNVLFPEIYKEEDDIVEDMDAPENVRDIRNAILDMVSGSYE